MYNTILFDLDGTLIDSAEGIKNSFRYAFAKLGLPEPTDEYLNNFIGPPLLDSFKNFCGFPPEKAAHAVEVYREYFAEKGVYQNRVYDGIEELLKKLKASGKTLVLATSKYELYALQIIENLGFSEYFDFAAGSLADGGRGTKAEVIEYALASIGAADKKSAVMVGDRMHDIEGAKAVGIDSIGVLFGFGSREELESHGATHIAATPASVYALIAGEEK
ncbi:MAG: HAD family hydrolase [Clostridia bacterium]|nr:HAD family hydrolase [Clostridia bacterium]